MRFSLGGVLLMLAGMQVVQAQEEGGFCGGSGRDTNGGGCRQERDSLSPMLAGDRGDFSALPNSSVLDLRTCSRIGCNESLDFTLDLKSLDLAAPTPNDETKTKLVDVLQFGVLSQDLFALGQNGYRVLAMSVLRGQSGDGYLIGFSWREEYEPSTDIPVGAAFPQELNQAFGELSGSERFITVSIHPVNGDWLNLEVDLRALNRDTGENRGVPLAYVEPGKFGGLPVEEQGKGLAQPTSTALAQPWSLRSGIIGGDLGSVGMTTDFFYKTPWIRAIYRASAGLPPES